MEPFYEKLDPDFLSVRTTTRQILQKEDDLNEIVQLVGKVGLFLALSMPCRPGLTSDSDSPTRVQSVAAWTKLQF